MLLQNFATGGLSSLLHFNFVQDFVIYLCTFVTNAVKNFACCGLSSLLYFNFVHDFIRYLCANCDKCCDKKFRLRRAFASPILEFREFLSPPQKLIPTYATARDCTICIYERPRGLSKRFDTLRVKKDHQLQILDPLMSSGGEEDFLTISISWGILHPARWGRGIEPPD